jgi:hypothetical protein
MGDVGNITKDIWQVIKLDFNGVSQDNLNTKSSSIGDRLSSWGQAAPKFMGISRKFWWGGRLPWNFTILAVVFPNFYPMPTHFQHFCGCMVWFIQIWRIAQKNLYLDEVFKESSLVVGCKMTKMCMGWTSMLVRSLHYWGKQKSYK